MTFRYQGGQQFARHVFVEAEMLIKTPDQNTELLPGKTDCFFALFPGKSVALTIRQRQPAPATRSF